ncbi:MAG: bifunctional oligoribonuclease/PAP phosphatase NrnA [Bacteroidales bacterium]|nr:bifunctional oligoribonuclease/PAP phosphatase NrnA [Bacteroidales bacterium]
MQHHSFFERFDAIIQSPERIVLACHVNPDGDAIGSVLGMSEFLKRKGHEVKMVVANDFPEFLHWMPGAQEFLVFEQNGEACQRAIADAECIIMLDFNNLSRGGILHNEIGKTRCPRILVDHHRDADLSQFYCAYSDDCVSSASEIVTEIILHYGKEQFTESIATNLLVGIMTDTGSFAHSIYHPRTFELCGMLVEHSLPYILIHQLVYDTMSENRLRLLGYSINNRMEVLDDYSTAIIALDKSDLEKFEYKTGDTEGVVNFPLSMKKIKMSVLITERQDQIRFSFRSKGNFSVHELANKYFKGGGHTNAAGGTLTCPFDEAVAKLKAVLPEYQEMLNMEE